MDAKRQRKQSPQYRKMTSSGNAPIKATMAAARSGRNNTVKGYLRADKLRKQEQAVIRNFRITAADGKSGQMEHRSQEVIQ
jgi:hypothetical protein